MIPIELKFYKGNLTRLTEEDITSIKSEISSVSSDIDFVSYTIMSKYLVIVVEVKVNRDWTRLMYHYIDVLAGKIALLFWDEGVYFLEFDRLDAPNGVEGSLLFKNCNPYTR